VAIAAGSSLAIVIAAEKVKTPDTFLGLLVLLWLLAGAATWAYGLDFRKASIVLIGVLMWAAYFAAILRARGYF
jgi:hypothetical protein